MIFGLSFFAFFLPKKLMQDYLGAVRILPPLEESVSQRWAIQGSRSCGEEEAAAQHWIVDQTALWITLINFFGHRTKEITILSPERPNPEPQPRPNENCDPHPAPKYSGKPKKLRRTLAACVYKSGHHRKITEARNLMLPCPG